MDAGMDGIMAYLRDTAAEIRPIVVNAARQQDSPMLITKLDIDRGEPEHTAGTRMVLTYASVTGAAASGTSAVYIAHGTVGAVAFYAAMPTPEVGTHASDNIIEALKHNAQIAQRWVPPAVV